MTTTRNRTLSSPVLAIGVVSLLLWSMLPALVASAQTTALVSDDFNALALGSQWTVVDPVGDGQVTMTGAGSGDAHVELSIPAGTKHDAYNTNESLRITQPTANTDFGIEARFDSLPTQRFQTQGLLIEADADNWLRFDVYSNGSQTKAYVGSTTGGSTSTIINNTITVSSAALWLRVTRTGDTWEFQTSQDGATYTTHTTFNQPLAVTATGPFVGNAGPAPATTASIDYVFDLSDPIDPEDAGDPGDPQTYPLDTQTAGSGTGSVTVDPDQATYPAGTQVTLTATPDPDSTFSHFSGDANTSDNPLTITVNGPTTITANFDSIVADETPPVISNVTATPAHDRFTVTWSTDEPATSAVQYGTTPALGLEASSGALVTEHSIEVVGLSAETTYHFQVASADAAGNESTVPDQTVTTTAAPPSNGPTIDVWEGLSQQVGHAGQPQTAANVRGRVSDPDGVQSITWQFGGGSALPLSIGPDQRRLASPGDFVVEVPYSQLAAGQNVVTLTATDGVGDVTQVDVALNYAPVTPSLPLTVDWDSVGSIQDVAQLVDGEWEILNGRLHPTVLDYDRTVAIGDISWTDYEATINVRVDSIDFAGGDPSPSNGPLVGLGLRWNGHTLNGNEQPAAGFYPVGAYTWHRWRNNKETMFLFGNNGSPNENLRQPLAVGVDHTYRVRVETVPGGTLYQSKLWPTNEPEPANWELSIVEDDGLPSGSIVLIAHHVDAHWGDLVVTPLSQAPTAPQITTQPADQTVNDGETATFTAAATGSGPLTYEWFRDGVSVPGATAAALDVVSTTSDHGAQFSLEATGPGGSAMSDTATLNVASGAPAGWWSPDHDVRLPFDVVGGERPVSDANVLLSVDLAAVAADAGSPGGTPSLDALRVVEVDAGGVVIDDAVPFQFDTTTGTTVAELVTYVAGATAPGDTRHFHLYIASDTSPLPPATFSDQVLTSSTVIDGQDTLQISAADATWFYDMDGGGFSSLLDADGNDWISYNTTPGAAGTYRGVPNMSHPDGSLHPGATNATTTVTSDGPLRVSLETTTPSGWDVRWDVTANDAVMSVLTAPQDYWFLYEGTPGGQFDPVADTVTRSGGVTTTAETRWGRDLAGPERVVFTDGPTGRTLFVQSHTDDSRKDSYRGMQDLMTVMGFGRSGSRSLIDDAPRQFSLGLADADPDGAADRALGLIHAVPGPAEPRP